MCKCVLATSVDVRSKFFYVAVLDNVSYTDEVTLFSNPTKQRVISRAPRFSHYISGVSMSALCFMNEINLQEGGRALPFRKSDMFPPGVRNPVIFLVCASWQRQRKAGFMIARFTGSLMRAAALSCLCGIKAASISAAVREGELGIGWQREDCWAHTSIHSLTGLEVMSWQRSPERRHNKLNGLILRKCNLTQEVHQSGSSYPAFNVVTTHLIPYFITLHM